MIQPEQTTKVKRVNSFLESAKDYYKNMNFMNSTSAQNAQVAALIFIGEQLERIATIMEKEEGM